MNVIAKELVPDLWSHRTDAASYWQPENHKTFLSGSDKTTLKKLSKPSLIPAQIMKSTDAHDIIRRYAEQKMEEDIDETLAELDETPYNKDTKSKMVGVCNVAVGIHPENSVSTNGVVIKCEAALHSYI